MVEKKTQTQKILDLLRRKDTVTTWQARRKYGIMNLRARISDLRAAGVKIDSVPYTRKDGEKNAVRYVLVD